MAGVEGQVDEPVIRLVVTRPADRLIDDVGRVVGAALPVFVLAPAVPREEAFPERGATDRELRGVLEIEQVADVVIEPGSPRRAATTVQDVPKVPLAEAGRGVAMVLEQPRDRVLGVG